MSTIWVFGDSFSTDYNNNSCFKDYVNWKGRPIKTFSNFIGEKYSMDIKNYAKPGWDNYSIFESLCKNSDEIRDGDFIFVGWGVVSRFRFIDNNNNWFTVNGENCHKYLSTFLDMDLNSYLNFLFNRNHILNEDEVNNWSKLISKAFPNNFIHLWRWGSNFVPSCEYSHGYETIKDETHGFIEDYHWSENGHEKFAQTIIPLIDSRIN